MPSYLNNDNLKTNNAQIITIEYNTIGCLCVTSDMNSILKIPNKYCTNCCFMN